MEHPHAKFFPDGMIPEGATVRYTDPLAFASNLPLRGGGESGSGSGSASIIAPSDRPNRAGGSGRDTPPALTNVNAPTGECSTCGGDSGGTTPAGTGASGHQHAGLATSAGVNLRVDNHIARNGEFVNVGEPAVEGAQFNSRAGDAHSGASVRPLPLGIQPWIEGAGASVLALTPSVIQAGSQHGNSDAGAAVLPISNSEGRRLSKLLGGDQAFLIGDSPRPEVIRVSAAEVQRGQYTPGMGKTSFVDDFGGVQFNQGNAIGHEVRDPDYPPELPDSTATIWEDKDKPGFWWCKVHKINGNSDLIMEKNLANWSCNVGDFEPTNNGGSKFFKNLCDPGYCHEVVRPKDLKLVKEEEWGGFVRKESTYVPVDIYADHAKVFIHWREYCCNWLFGTMNTDCYYVYGINRVQVSKCGYCKTIWYVFDTSETFFWENIFSLVITAATKGTHELIKDALKKAYQDAKDRIDD